MTAVTKMAVVSNDLNAGVAEEGVSRNVLVEARERGVRKLLSEHPFVTQKDKVKHSGTVYPFLAKSTEEYYK